MKWSPTKVKQSLRTLTWTGNSCVSIQSFVLSKCASASLSGLPAYLGLKWDQFNCGLYGTSRTKGVKRGWGILIWRWILIRNLIWAFGWDFDFNLEAVLDFLHLPLFFFFNFFWIVLYVSSFFLFYYYFFFLPHYQMYILLYIHIYWNLFSYFWDPKWAPMLCKVVGV